MIEAFAHLILNIYLDGRRTTIYSFLISQGHFYNLKLILDLLIFTITKLIFLIALDTKALINKSSIHFAFEVFLVSPYLFDLSII